MQIDHSRREEGPIAIGEPYFAALAGIESEASAILKRLIAAHYNVPEGVTDGSIDALDGLDDLDVEFARRYFSEAKTPSYSITFASGTTIQTSDNREAILAASSEPSEIKSIEFAMGRYRDFHIKIAAGGYYGVVFKYDIRGTQDNIHHFEALIKRMIANSEVDHPLLHSAWLSRLIVLITFVAFCATYILVADWFAAGKSQDVVNALSAGFFPVTAGAFFVAMSVAERFRKAFPPLEFSLGLSARRTRSKRTAIFWVASSIVVPIVLSGLKLA